MNKQQYCHMRTYMYPDNFGKLYVKIDPSFLVTKLLNIL